MKNLLLKFILIKFEFLIRHPSGMLDLYKF